MNIKLPISADGMRGIAYSWPLNKQGCVSLGMAIGEYLNGLDAKSSVMIARDTRPSSPNLYSFLRHGLFLKGIDVQDLNIITTPALAYLTKNGPSCLGIMVTASHNPVEFNGIKIIDANGKRASDTLISMIEKHLNTLDATFDNYSENIGWASTNNDEFLKRYIKDQIVQSNLKSLRGLNLVIDCANGATSHLIPNAFGELGANIHVVNQYEGTNEINLRSGTEYFRQRPFEFAKIITDNDADYGVSFDGDGDRLLIIDRAANIYNGDDFLYVLGVALSEAGRLNKNTVVTTHMANSGLISSLRTRHIKVLKTRNGDKYLEDEIGNNNYCLGGEQFGNIIIHDDYHIAADPFYALLHLLKLMMISPLSDLVKSFKKWPQALIRLKFDEMNLNSKLEEHIEMATKNLGTGSRIQYWQSSTEPGLYNIMVEGPPDVNYGTILKEARVLCEKISNESISEIQFIPLSERAY